MGRRGWKEEEVKEGMEIPRATRALWNSLQSPCSGRNL
jgi:hypothetical protein